MSRKVKSLIITGAALLLLVGAFFALRALLPEEEEDPGSENEQLFLLYDESDSGVESITVEYGGESYVVEKISAAEYGIAQIMDHVKSDASFASMVTTVQRVSTYVKIEKVGSLSEYGLNRPQAVITVKFDNGSTHKIKVGNLNASGTGYYTICDDDSEVYVLPQSTIEPFLATKTSFVDLSILGQYDTEDKDSVTFSYFEITRPDLEKPIHIRAVTADEAKSSGGTGPSMRMDSPVYSLVLDDAIENYMYTIFGVKAQSCVELNLTEDKLAQYGLDTPTATLRTKFNNTEVTFTAGGYADEEKTSYYLTISKIPEYVFVVAASDLKWITVTADQFVSPVAVQPYIQNIETITLQMKGGKVHTFTLEHPVDQATGKVNTTVSCDGTELEIKQFRRYLQLLLYTSGEKIYTGEPVDDSNAPLVITYQYNNGAPTDTVKILNNTGRYGVMEVNGSQSFTARLAYIDKLETEFAHLLAGEDVDTEW